eukprot:12033802-Alexandrium_andersonii.AAC.1
MQRACTCSCPALGRGGGVNWPRLALGQRCPRAQRPVCEAARLGAPTNSNCSHVWPRMLPRRADEPKKWPTHSGGRSLTTEAT